MAGGWYPYRTFSVPLVNFKQAKAVRQSEPVAASDPARREDGGSAPGAVAVSGALQGTVGSEPCTGTAEQPDHVEEGPAAGQ